MSTLIDQLVRRQQIEESTIATILQTEQIQKAVFFTLKRLGCSLSSIHHVQVPSTIHWPGTDSQPSLSDQIFNAWYVLEWNLANSTYLTNPARLLGKEWASFGLMYRGPHGCCRMHHSVCRINPYDAGAPLLYNHDDMGDKVLFVRRPCIHRN